MSDNELHTDISVNVITLLSALVALILLSRQLFGQNFAPAERFRRGQSSAMGPWAKRTRLQWRWSQFRFETLYTTPEIVLSCFCVDQRHQRVPQPPGNDIEWITGSLESQEKTLMVSPSVDIMTDETVSWLLLLRDLHRQEWELQRHGCYNGRQPGLRLAGSALRFRERSWDSVSPETVRPCAITSISDVAVLARRLGMTWTDFRPEDGIMRAEGNGHVISSTFVRSIGIILQYMSAGAGSVRASWPSIGELSKSELYVSFREADMMGFGILPGYGGLQIPIYKMGTIDEVCATMDILDPTRKASRRIRDVRGIEPRCTFGFSDIISLSAPMLHTTGSSIIRLPVLTEYCVGLTSHQEGFVVFHNRLKEYMTETEHVISDQAKWVLQQYETLKAHYPEWENEGLANDQVNDRSQDFLNDSHACWDAATEYFVDLQRTENLRYQDLMASHVTQAVNYWGDAWARIKEGKARNHYGLRPLVAEGMHMYWDYLPNIVVAMRSKGFRGEEGLVHEAWFTMMFRAFCWWRCHFMNPGENMVQAPMRLPSRYWDSELPVYIE